MVPNYMGLHKDWKKFVSYGRTMENHGLYYYEWRDEYADYPTNNTHTYKTVTTTLDLDALRQIILEAMSKGLVKQVLSSYQKRDQ